MRRARYYREWGGSPATAIPGESLGTVTHSVSTRSVIRSFSGRQAAVGAEGVLLFGVVAHGDASRLRAVGAEVVSLRQVVALVARVPYGRMDATTSAIAEYRTVVEGAFADRAVVPAPFGTVFRSRDHLVRWMELHYVALLDALSFVDGKAAARLRMVARRDAAGPDFESAVFDSVRALARHSVASVSRADAVTHGPRTADASFLVERDRWSAFADAVRDEAERTDALAIEQGGPWPAYDFVRLQFGA